MATRNGVISQLCKSGRKTFIFLTSGQLQVSNEQNTPLWRFHLLTIPTARKRSENSTYYMNFHQHLQKTNKTETILFSLKWAGESCPAPFVAVRNFIYNSVITGRRIEEKYILTNFMTCNSQKNISRVRFYRGHSVV